MAAFVRGLDSACSSFATTINVLEGLLEFEKTTGRTARIRNGSPGSHGLKTFGSLSMTEFSVKPLDTRTWPDFARLVEAHNGIGGGRWCMEFHTKKASPV